LSALGIQSGEELTEVLELLGLDGMEDLLGSFPSASSAWQSGVRGAGESDDKLWAWVNGGEGSSGDGSASDSDDEWYREARDFYGEVG
jgi:hypothetical protein